MGVDEMEMEIDEMKDDTSDGAGMIPVTGRGWYQWQVALLIWVILGNDLLRSYASWIGWRDVLIFSHASHLSLSLSILRWLDTKIVLLAGALNHNSVTQIFDCSTTQSGNR